MATNSTDTPKRGRPKKETTDEIKETVNLQSDKKEEKKVNNDELKETQNALSEAMNMIETLKAQMEEMSHQPQVVVQQESSKGAQKIKCISIAHHPVNVYTRPNAKGRMYSFKQYGSIQHIKYDDLIDIIAAYPNTMKSGMIYICDNDIIMENDLVETKDKIYSKERMDKLVYLRSPSDVDLLLGMEQDLLESTIAEIVRLYKANEKMDANALARIKEETKFDIIAMAEEIKG